MLRGGKILLMTIDQAGRSRIAKLVTYELGRLSLTRPRIADMWRERISPATVTRIQRGDSTVAEQYIWAINDLLDMPRGFLTYVGEADTKRVEQSGAEPDLIRWTLDLIRNDYPTNSQTEAGEAVE